MVSYKPSQGGDMMKGNIYSIKNILNGWTYIGMTTRTCEERFKQHRQASKSGSNMFIHWALRNYGIDNFKFREIASVSVDKKEDIYELERYHINELNTYKGDGYNMHEGGNIIIKSKLFYSPDYIACLDTHCGNIPTKISKIDYLNNKARYLPITSSGYYKYLGVRYTNNIDMPFKISMGPLKTRCIKNNTQFLRKNYFTNSCEPYTTEEIERFIFEKVTWKDLGWGFEYIEPSLL